MATQPGTRSVVFEIGPNLSMTFMWLIVFGAATAIAYIFMTTHPASASFKASCIGNLTANQGQLQNVSLQSCNLEGNATVWISTAETYILALRNG